MFSLVRFGVLLVFLRPFEVLSQGKTCYYPDGTPSGDSVCSDGYRCCPPGSKCKSGNFGVLCSRPGNHGGGLSPIRGTCTDKTWQSTSCPHLCLNEDNFLSSQQVMQACPQDSPYFGSLRCQTTNLKDELHLEQDCYYGYHLLQYQPQFSGYASIATPSEGYRSHWLESATLPPLEKAPPSPIPSSPQPGLLGTPATTSTFTKPTSTTATSNTQSSSFPIGSLSAGSFTTPTSQPASKQKSGGGVSIGAAVGGGVGAGVVVIALCALGFWFYRRRKKRSRQPQHGRPDMLEPEKAQPQAQPEPSPQQKGGTVYEQPSPDPIYQAHELSPAEPASPVSPVPELASGGWRPAELSHRGSGAEDEGQTFASWGTRGPHELYGSNLSEFPDYRWQ